MQIIAIQPESHKDDLYPQFLFKQRADRDAAATTHGYRGFPKSSLDSHRRRLISFAVDRRHIGLAAMMLLRFDRDAFGGDSAEIVKQLFRDNPGGLVGDEPGGDLGVGLGRQRRLGALAGVATPETVGLDL